MVLFRVSILLLTSILLTGCIGSGEDKTLDYRSARTAPTLEIPPDLSRPETDERYQLPENATASLSQYEALRASGQDRQARSVLPEVPNARMERAGGQRWLVVDTSPDKLWPVLKQFWEENGFILIIDEPRLGIMETDWAENRARIAQGWLRSMVGRVFDRAFDAGERDKFRTRLERSADGMTTEIYITHRGLSEEYIDSCDTMLTGWVFRPSDPELEAIMNMRLLQVLGIEEKKAEAIVRGTDGTPQFERAKIMEGADRQSVLVVNDAFDRAWRRIGLALDRVGFTVEDRDRSQGMYYVRYIDPDDDADRGSKKGILSSLAFWRSDEPAANVSQLGQYRIVVRDNGNETTVQVLDKEGNLETSSVAGRILKLLHEQLK